MSADLQPITRDASVCKTLSCLPEKWLVDFANGIDVARDHVQVQRTRTNFFTRMSDGFTGKGAMRQADINASLIDGVEGALQWLGELSEFLAHSNWAITQVNDRVTSLTRNVAELAHYSADTREQLHQLSQRLDVRMNSLSQELQRIDFVQKAQLNLDATFSKWGSGRLNTLSPAARCYASLEELRWGAFGDYCRNFQESNPRQCDEFMQLVVDKATEQLAEDVGVSLHTPIPTVQVWLSVPNIPSNEDAEDLWQAVDYLADGLSHEVAPFVQSAAQRQPVHLHVPLVAHARRVAHAMAQEVFPVSSKVVAYA